MVDMNTNRVIDMIETRDYESVCEWLKNYPNLEVVSRDGSITYKNAIDAVHPKAVQISDRFHLLKNLTKYAMEYLKKKLNVQIAIPSGENAVLCEDKSIILSKANENRKLTAAEKYDKITKLRQLGYTKTQMCGKLQKSCDSKTHWSATHDRCQIYKSRFYSCTCRIWSKESRKTYAIYERNRFYA